MCISLRPRVRDSVRTKEVSNLASTATGFIFCKQKTLHKLAIVGFLQSGLQILPGLVTEMVSFLSPVLKNIDMLLCGRVDIGSHKREWWIKDGCRAEVLYSATIWDSLYCMFSPLLGDNCFFKIAAKKHCRLGHHCLKPKSSEYSLIANLLGPF